MTVFPIFEVTSVNANDLRSFQLRNINVDFRLRYRAVRDDFVGMPLANCGAKEGPRSSVRQAAIVVSCARSGIWLRARQLFVYNRISML